MEHFDTIHNSPSHIYHSALPLSPPSWLHKCYRAELSHIAKVVKGPTEWGKCSRTVVLDEYTCTLSHHNHSIAVASKSRDIIILDTITGTQAAVLSGHTDFVNCIVFLSDGTSLVSGSDDKTVKVWDAQTGGVVKTLYGHTKPIVSVSVSADHATAASGSWDCTICLWDIKTGGCHCTINQKSSVEHVIFSPTDPQHLISICDDQVWQWDANGHKIKPPFDGEHVSFSSDGAQFISCYKKAIRVYNSNSGATVVKLKTTDSKFPWCSFSPDSRLVAVAVGRVVHCWDITSSKPCLVETFIGHADDITSLLFSSPTTLISASRDKSVKFWQIRAQTTDPAVNNPKSTPLPSAPIESITLQAKDGIVITSDSDGIVQTWDISTGIHKATFQTPAKDHRRDVRLINDRLTLVYYKDKKVYRWDIGHKKTHIWDTGNKKLLWERTWDIFGLWISGDGSIVFCWHGYTVQAWSIQKGEFVGGVYYDYPKGDDNLTVDGSNFWVHDHESGWRGWDFGISSSAPTELSGMPALSSASMLWDPSQCRIKNAVTGGVIFQLSGRFANPTDVQCDGSHLVAGYLSGEILILDLKDVMP